MSSLYTMDDYYELGEHEERKYIRWELIKGIFKMAPAPLNKHQKVSVSLSGELYAYFKKRKCKLRAAPFEVRLDNHTVVQPDICVICDERKMTRRGCAGAPDFIVEIISRSSEKIDLQEKYYLYEEHGVKEYWVVHPEKKWVDQYVLTDNKFKLISAFRDIEEGDIITSHLFPELEINLFDIFD